MGGIFHIKREGVSKNLKSGSVRSEVYKPLIKFFLELSNGITILLTAECCTMSMRTLHAGKWQRFVWESWAFHSTGFFENGLTL